MFLWFLFAPFFTMIMFLIGLQLMYHVLLVVGPVLIIALVIWLLYKLVRRCA